MSHFKIYYLLFFVLLTPPAVAQEFVTVFGKVTDAITLEPVEYTTIYAAGGRYLAESDVQGNYRIELPADTSLELFARRIGFREVSYTVPAMEAGSRRLINFSMAPQDMEIEVIVRGSRVQDKGMIRERVEDLKLLPSASGNLESLLPSIALGTYGGTGGELSSQYNVRGGNYDENLVYVNDFEIYRPQLVSSSQQEGLSFPNINLISSLAFSSGGFKASYGDKLSSVLDIRYKRPDSLAGSLEASFLGAGAHVEGGGRALGLDNNRLRFLAGARYKTTRYLLGSLDTEGEFQPDFYDIQAYLTYDLDPDWQVGLMGNYNRSVFHFTPTERSTALGLIDFALQLNSAFVGQERDDFTSGMGGLSLTYIPERQKNPFFLKFLASATGLDENERFDILGFYRLSQIESNLGSDDFEEEVAVLGSGLQHEYVRNFLDATIFNLQHKGGYELNVETARSSTTASHFLEWGVQWKREEIEDRINEWERLDSAGYSLPYDPGELTVNQVLKSLNFLESNRYSAFVQNTWSKAKADRYEMSVIGGLRASYWDLNDEFLLSPRLQWLYKPSSWERDFSFKLAAGLYHQPPFYRELRRPDGSLNRDLLAQKSLHIVGGFTWDFRLGSEPPKDFRFIAEVYYKKLWDLVTYEVDNVKIRYSGENDAEGYAVGLDLRLNGEFVPGAESWINLGLLRTRENLNGIQHLKRELGEAEAREVKDVPRPTDQFLNLSMFFQDYLPDNENFKMHLNLNIGTGLPFGLRGNNRVYRNTYRYAPYHRVDIGFSALLWERAWRADKPDHFLRFTKKAWVSLEVFNLLDVQNEASKTWIKTVFNQQYAVPNYLTGRRLNLRLRMEF